MTACPNCGWKFPNSYSGIRCINCGTNVDLRDGTAIKLVENKQTFVKILVFLKYRKL
jgi:predicted amidophosphoribosyltransferase